jgi:hypothetical protein
VGEGIHFNLSNGVFDTNELQINKHSAEPTLITDASMKQDLNHCFLLQIDSAQFSYFMPPFIFRNFL